MTMIASCAAIPMMGGVRGGFSWDAPLGGRPCSARTIMGIEEVDR